MRQPSFEDAQRRVLARYGVEAESLLVEAPSLAGRAHVLAAGQGPPLIMLNGGGVPAAMLAPLMAALPGRAVYAIDHPGHGSSSHCASYTDGLRSNAVRLLTEVMDGLGLERVPVVASSFGSLCATWLALDRPARVTALAHLGCPAVVLDTAAPLPMRLLSVSWLARLLAKVPPSPRQVEQLARMVGEHPLEPEIAELLLASQSRPELAPAFHAIVQSLVRLRGQRPELALTAEQLEAVTQPSLLVFGERDPFGGAAVGDRMAEALRDAELHLVDAGHAPWLRHAEPIAGWLGAFLTRVDQQSARPEAGSV